MNFDGEDPNHLGQFYGAVQRNVHAKRQQEQMGLQKQQIELERQILDMQKLQVLNQVRISQGLKPLAELPKPTPRQVLERIRKEHQQFPASETKKQIGFAVCVGVVSLVVILLYIVSR